MGKNRIWGYITCLIIILIIAIPSTYKVITKHNERLLKNTIQKIVDTARDCYYNSSCVDDKITLKELYEKMSLTPIYNPITKKIYNEESYVSVKEDFKFVEK